MLLSSLYFCRGESWPSLPSGKSPSAPQASNNVQWGPKKGSPKPSTDESKKSDSSLTPAAWESGSGSNSGANNRRDKGSPSPQRSPRPPNSSGAQVNGPVTAKEPPKTMFGSGSSTVFSLSKEKELVKSQDRRGKARGRGRANPISEKTDGATGAGVGRSQQRANRPVRYSAPKSGSGGITVIEPSDREESSQPQKQEVAGQFEDGAAIEQSESTEGRPGLPLRGSGSVVGVASSSTVGGASSTETRDSVEQGKEEGAGEKREAIPPVTQVHQQQGEGSQQQLQEAEGPGGVAQSGGSKPKRYSSQRQKTGGQAEGQG